MLKKFGVIDIGTLKVKLQVVEKDPNGELKTVCQSNTLTCLGLRMEENGNRPHPENLAQTLTELVRCKTLLEKEKVNKIRVVSTHALREMGAVGQEVATLINKKIGLKVEIISQQEEAELFYRAVMNDFRTDSDFTIVDVGSGSVQVLVGNRNKLKQAFLLKSGAQYLHDRFSPRHSGTDCPTEKEIREMKKYILDQLAPIPENINTPIVYGSSNIIDVFKAVKLPLVELDLSLAHPYKTMVTKIKEFVQAIIPVSYDEREKKFPFSQKYYMWGIDTAFLNVVLLADKVGAKEVIPSNANINQGLLLSMQNQG